MAKRDAQTICVHRPLNRVALALHPEGLYVAHVVSVLCRRNRLLLTKPCSQLLLHEFHHLFGQTAEYSLPFIPPALKGN